MGPFFPGAHTRRELIGASDESSSRTTHDWQELPPLGDCNPQRDGDSATRRGRALRARFGVHEGLMSADT